MGTCAPHNLQRPYGLPCSPQLEDFAQPQQHAQQNLVAMASAPQASDPNVTAAAQAAAAAAAAAAASSQHLGDLAAFVASRLTQEQQRQLLGDGRHNAAAALAAAAAASGEGGGAAGSSGQQLQLPGGMTLQPPSLPVQRQSSSQALEADGASQQTAASKPPLPPQKVSNCGMLCVHAAFGAPTDCIEWPLGGRPERPEADHLPAAECFERLHSCEQPGGHCCQHAAGAMASDPSHSICLLQGAQSYFGQGHWPYAMQQVRHTLPATHALPSLEGGPAPLVCMLGRFSLPQSKAPMSTPRPCRLLLTRLGSSSGRCWHSLSSRAPTCSRGSSSRCCWRGSWRSLATCR